MTEVLLAGRYELLGRIAAGGMAEVLAARLRGEDGFTRVVAVKRMLPHLASDPQFVEMFLDEARLAAHVHGAHVVATLDLGRDENAAPFIVMDLVIGVTLAQLQRASMAREGPLPIAIALEILADAAQGLEEAHQARNPDGTPLGVVHRDVSPQNILVGADGHARVADFGVARALFRSTNTETGDLKGKYAYFSPEQSRGSAVDARSDVFAMGIVCWEVLTGHRLFKAEDPVQSVERVRSMPVPPIESLRDGVPESARRAVMHALERDLDQRLPHAGELATVLRRAAVEAGSHGATSIAWLVAELAPTQVAAVETLLRTSALPAGETSSAADGPLSGVVTLPGTDPRSAGAGAADVPSTRVAALPSPSASPKTEPASLQPSRGSRAAVPLAVAGLAIGAAALAVALIVTMRPSARTSGPEAGDGTPNGAHAERVAEEPIRLPPHPPSRRSVLRVGTRVLVDLKWVGIPPAIEWRLGHEGADGTRVPVYVARLPSIANGDARILPDGRFEVVWRLRAGARWSDGHALTAEDVVLGYRVDPPPHLSDARARSREVAVITWREPVDIALDPPLPAPRHVVGALFDSRGAAAVDERRRNSIVPTLGPYRVREYVAGRRVVLEANPHFPGPAPAIAHVVIERNSDRDALLRAVEAGRLDLLFPNSILLDQARALRERRADLVYIRPSAFLVFLQPDLARAPFDRLEVRKALLMAIDRERLVRQTYGAEGRVAYAPTTSPPPDLQPYAYDSRASAEILRREGVLGSEISVLVAPDVGHHMADIVAEDLRAVGLRAVVRETEEHAAYRDGHHGGLLMYAVETERDVVIDQYWGLPMRGGAVDTSVRNAAFDDATAAVLDRCNFAESPERAAEYRAALVRAYASRLPQLPLVFAAERVVADPVLRGWDVPPGDPFGFGIEGWYFSR